MRVFPAVLLGLWLVVASPLSAQGPAAGGRPAPVPLDSIPPRFELWQDKQGFAWQMTQSGGLQSGSQNSFLQGAMTLQISGADFTGEKGQRFDGGRVEADGAWVALQNTVGSLAVVRDVYFDPRRAGVRYLDVIKNEGKKPAEVEVVLKCGYQYPWQDLHRVSGQVISESEFAMKSSDSALLVTFGRSEGRPDTVLLFGGEDAELRPVLKMNENQREFSLVYRLSVPGSGEVALVHWILQRRLGRLEEARTLLRPFYLRRQLVSPRIADAQANWVRNFRVTRGAMIPELASVPALGALHQLLRDTGIRRSWDDVLWLGPRNQLAGEVDRSATLEVETRFGTREGLLAEVAAIQGGEGFGRDPRIFLRDGRVWVGPAEADGLALRSRDGIELEQLDLAETGMLVLAAEDQDGLVPEGAQSYLALRGGEVLALEAAEPIELLSPWGPIRVPIAEIESFRYVRDEVPKYRLRKRNGTRLSVLPGGDALKIQEAGGGEAELRLSEVLGIWDPRVQVSGDDLDNLWLEIEDLGEVDKLRLPLCLMQGNNVVHGSLGGEALHLVSGPKVTVLRTGEIVRMRRLDGRDELPQFEVELKGGDVLTGRLRERFVTLESSSGTWSIPVTHFLGFLESA